MENPELRMALRIIYGLNVSASDIINLLNKHKQLPDVPPPSIEPSGPAIILRKASK